MRVHTPDTTLKQLPNSVVLAVSGARDNELLSVWFNPGGGYQQVARPRADDQGYVDYMSVALPYDSNAGTYYLQVRDSAGTAVATRAITVAGNSPNNPRVIGADATPVLVPESTAGDVRKWVLQDLTPGGLGSWVMPFNPRNMTSPHKGDEVTPAHSTSTNGNALLWQAGDRPKDWQFDGYTGLHEVVAQLQAYADLDRRIYVIDHRGRAWKVVLLDVQLTPRRDYFGPAWMHDYVVRGLVYNPNSPHVPA